MGGMSQAYSYVLFSRIGKQILWFKVSESMPNSTFDGFCGILNSILAMDCLQADTILFVI